MTKVNLNTQVHFTLTEAGVRHVQCRWESEGDTLLCFRKEGDNLWSAPRPKAGMPYRCLLWEFAQMFGSALSMGKPPPTENNNIFLNLESTC